MTDHFTTMLYTHLTDEALLVGARNILYKLSVDELRLKQTLTWHSLGKSKKSANLVILREINSQCSVLDMDRESCIVKGNDAEECQNYIKVLQQYNNDPDRYMICGTNAYRPSCRQYIDERGSYVLREETACKLN